MGAILGAIKGKAEGGSPPQLNVGLFGALEDQKTRKILKLVFFQFTSPMFSFQAFTFPFLFCSVLVLFHILQWNSRLQIYLERSNTDFFFETTKTQWRSLKHRDQMPLLVFLVCKHTSLTAAFSVINRVIFFQWFYLSFSVLYLLRLLEKIYWLMKFPL